MRFLAKKYFLNATNFRSSENGLRFCQQCHLWQRFSIACFWCDVVDENLRFTPKKLQIGAQFQVFFSLDREFVVTISVFYLMQIWIAILEKYFWKKYFDKKGTFWVFCVKNAIFEHSCPFLDDNTIIETIKK